MFEATIDLTGLADAIASSEVDLTNRLMQGMQTAGQVLVREAKKRTPVDTGHLRRSIRSEVAADDDGMVVKVGTNVHYAIHVEYGHRTPGGKSYVPGRYMLKGALDSQRTNVLRVISRTLIGRR